MTFTITPRKVIALAVLAACCVNMGMSGTLRASCLGDVSNDNEAERLKDNLWRGNFK